MHYCTHAYVHTYIHLTPAALQKDPCTLYTLYYICTQTTPLTSIICPEHHFSCWSHSCLILCHNLHSVAHTVSEVGQLHCEGSGSSEGGDVTPIHCVDECDSVHERTNCTTILQWGLPTHCGWEGTYFTDSDGSWSTWGNCMCIEKMFVEIAKRTNLSIVTTIISRVWLTNKVVVDSVSPHTVVSTTGVVASISCLHRWDGQHCPLHHSTVTIHSLSVLLKGVLHCRRVGWFWCAVEGKLCSVE